MKELIGITGDGFNHECLIVFNQHLSAEAAARGPPTTGISERRSIDNFTTEQLISLGIGFSSQPAALDRTVANFWNADDSPVRRPKIPRPALSRARYLKAPPTSFQEAPCWCRS